MDKNIYNNLSDRELLIRIDERQIQMNRTMSSLKTKVETLDTKYVDLDKEKIGKTSISWFIAIIGGVLGIISSAVALYIPIK